MGNMKKEWILQCLISKLSKEFSETLQSGLRIAYLQPKPIKIQYEGKENYGLLLHRMNEFKDSKDFWDKKSITHDQKHLFQEFQSWLQNRFGFKIGESCFTNLSSKEDDQGYFQLDDTLFMADALLRGITRSEILEPTNIGLQKEIMKEQQNQGLNV